MTPTLAEPDITDNDLHLFTNGNCLDLACVLSERTGWPICAPSFDNNPGWPEWHAAVLTPDGYVLDVEGVRMPDEWMTLWAFEHDTAALRTFTLGAFTAREWERRMYRGDATKRRALEVAQILLDAIGFIPSPP